jgi:uncharacterized cupin superfamily protein
MGTWKRAGIGEIPALGEAASRDYWQRWTDDPSYTDGWHSIRRYFGIRAFGANAKEASKGELLVVPHAGDDHDRQEELYVMIRGRARFECDGEDVEMSAGDLLYVPPEVRREAIALETPTVVMVVGGTPGEAYPAD